MDSLDAHRDEDLEGVETSRVRQRRASRVHIVEFALTRDQLGQHSIGERRSVISVEDRSHQNPMSEQKHHELPTNRCSMCLLEVSCEVVI